MTLTRAFSLTLLASLATLVACSGSDSTPETPGADGQTTTPPPGGETPATQDPGGQQATPPPPPPLKEPPSEDKITEEFGVFVSAQGTDGAPGTRTQPLKSIQQGIQLAQSTSRFVYVCTGTYHEAVTVAPGIPIIGGFECGASGWKLGTTVNSRVESPTSPAIRATGVELLTRIEGIDFAAPNGTEEAPTSIGLLAKNSKGLWFERVNVTAGNGHDGQPGSEPAQGLVLQVAIPAASGGGEWWLGINAGATPNPMVRTEGGRGGTGTCVGVIQVPANSGGAGGINASLAAEPCSGQFCARPFRWDIYAAPGPGTVGAGTPAVNGTNGTSATSPGLVTEDGFQPRPGTTGTKGTIGQGGDGANGASTVRVYPDNADQGAFTLSGGGGGVGGCYGLPGSAGGGGGASIGALIVASEGITFANSSVTAKNGGAGGKGSFGSPATAGSSGGGNGGAGRPGGHAGISGSGAGGSSIGIATKGGAATMINSSKATAGTAGAGVAVQTKDEPLGTKTIPASAGGVAKDVETF